MKTYHTLVANKSWLLFLNGVKHGSPRSKFAKMLPANMVNIVENQQARGCFRENCCAPEGKGKIISFIYTLAMVGFFFRENISYLTPYLLLWQGNIMRHGQAQSKDTFSVWPPGWPDQETLRDPY